MAKKTEEEDVEPIFQEEEVEFRDEAEIADPDEGLPEEIKKLSRQDLYARVKDLEGKAASQPDPTERIAKAVEGAFSKVSIPQTPAAPQKVETEAEFRARLKTDLFDEEKAEGILNELVDRRLGPRFLQMQETAFKTTERLLETDASEGTIYKRYKGEVQEVLQTLPPEIRKTPQALEFAFKQVKINHIDDIASERAKILLEEERKKAEEREETETTPPRRQPLRMETGGRGEGATSSRKIVVGITQEDRRIADELGVDPSEIARRRAR